MILVSTVDLLHVLAAGGAVCLVLGLLAALPLYDVRVRGQG